MRHIVLKPLHFTALFFLGKGIMAALVKSSGHFLFSYIFWQMSQTSRSTFTPRFFNISAGISSTLTAYPSFISDIVDKISLHSIAVPFSSPFTSSSSLICKSSVFCFTSLPYRDPMNSSHLDLTSSDSVILYFPHRL